MSVMTEEEMDYQIELQKLYSNESDSAENLYEFSESELSAHDAQTRADERAKINDELSEVQQILILYDVDTAEKRREIIDLLEQIKAHK